MKGKKMKLVFGILLISMSLASCSGPESDAKDVCDCYKEVVAIKDDVAKADEKLSECLELLEKYQEKHKDEGTIDAFNKAYDHCR